MKFEKFKKHITRIQNTYEKEEILSKCIEENLTTSTFCIVDICEDAISSVIELLADYYNCYFDVLRTTDNDISWWLYAEEKIVYINDEEVHLDDVYALWKYLEENRNIKIMEGTYKSLLDGGIETNDETKNNI